MKPPIPTQVRLINPTFHFICWVTPAANQPTFATLACCYSDGGRVYSERTRFLLNSTLSGSLFPFRLPEKPQIGLSSPTYGCFIKQAQCGNKLPALCKPQKRLPEKNVGRILESDTLPGDRLKKRRPHSSIGL